MVRANPDGSFVRVRDVARVELARAASESRGRQDGSPAAVHRPVPVAGSNALNSADTV